MEGPEEKGRKIPKLDDEVVLNAFEHFSQGHFIQMPPEQNVKLKCGQCIFTTYDENVLLAHRNTHKSAKKVLNKKTKVQLSCSQCKFSTSDEILLISHIKKHTIMAAKVLKKKILPGLITMDITETLKCGQCTFTTNDLNVLISHRKQHIDKTYSKKVVNIKCNPDLPTEVDDTLKCAQCNFITNDPNVLIVHIKTHKVPDKKCPYCGYGTWRKMNLEKHVHSMHKWQNDLEKKVPITYKIFYCKFCSFSALGESFVKKHEKSCKMDPEIQNKSGTKDKHQCPYCEYSTNVGRCIDKHVRTKHKAQNDFEKKFTFIQDLKKAKLF